MPSKETSHMQEQEVEISWEFHKSRVTVCTWLSVSKPAISISNFTLSKQFVVDSCLMTQKQTVSFIEQHILWQSTVIEVGTMAWSILDSLALPQRLAVSRWVTVVKLYKCVCHEKVLHRFTLLVSNDWPQKLIDFCYKLYNLFPSFLRHTFWQYRKENPQTKVGEPPPDGLPGFNSGVMLLNLGAMRASALYNELLEPSNVAKLADQYRFRGHLGDQDFFTMIGMEHPELFYSLSCGWNRQLCTWWRDHGYGDVFQLYYRCGGPVYIYHGNCNTPIPDDWCVRAGLMLELKKSLTFSI